jgi:hypothetical protein
MHSELDAELTQFFHFPELFSHSILQQISRVVQTQREREREREREILEYLVLGLLGLY